MSRKIVVYALIAICVLMALAMTAAGGLYLVREREEARWLAEGNRHFEEGTYNLAKFNYVNYIGRNKGDLDALRRYAEASMLIAENRRKNLADAATAYHQIERNMEPGTAEHGEIVGTLTKLYIRIEAWGDLQFFAEQQLALAPGDADLQFALATAYYNQSRFDEAQTTLQLLIAEGTDQPAVYRLLADIFYERRLDTQAAATLDAALAAFPVGAGVYAERAKFYWRIHDRARAMAELDRAVERDPQHGETLYLQALYRVSTGDFEGAAQFAERAAEADPARPEVYSILAHAYRRTNRTQEAIAVLGDLDPLIRADFPPLLLAHAEMLFSEGALEEGKAVVKEYEADFPEHRIVRDYFRGRVALLENKPDEAVKILQIVYRDQPAFTPAHYFLGLAYLAAGQREAARETFDIYLRQHPEDQMARAVMAQEFGRFQDLQTLIEVARGQLTNPSASASELVSASGPLIDAALARGLGKDVESLVRELLAAAIARDALEVNAYRALMDMETALGDADAADAAFEAAKAAGVAEDELAISRANALLRKGDRNAVRAIFVDQLAAPDDAAEQGRAWAEFLSGRGETDLALEAMDAAEASIPAEEAARWALLRAELLARNGSMEEARALLSAHENAGGTAQRTRTRLEIARRLAQSDEAAQREAAATLVEAVLAENPGDAGAVILKADLLVRRGTPDYAGGQALLDELLARDPANVRALMAASGLSARRGDLKKALELAEQATAVDPGLVVGLRRVAELQIELNLLREARELLEKAIERYPNDPALLRLLIEAYMRQGLGREAERTLAQLDALAEENADAASIAASVRGEFLEQRGQAADAEPLLRAEFASAPDSASAASALAENLMRQGRQDEAFSIMETWTSSHSTQSEGWIALSRLYQIQGGSVAYGKASTALTRSLVADPNNLSALREMTELNMRMGNYVNASTFADRFLSIRPDDAEILYRKATLLARERSRLREALAYADQAIALRTDNEYRSLRGFIYLALEEYEPALTDLRAVAESYTTTPAEVDLAIAEGYLGMRDFNMGRRFYDLAVQKAGEGQNLDPGRLSRVESILQAG